MPHHLLHLPFEIRSIIYSFVFIHPPSDQPISLTLIERHEKDRTDDLKRPHLKHPTWTPLQTCRQLREEGLPIFYSGNTFSIYLSDFDQYLKHLEHPSSSPDVRCQYLRSLIIKHRVCTTEWLRRQRAGEFRDERLREIEMKDKRVRLEFIRDRLAHLLLKRNCALKKVEFVTEFYVLRRGTCLEPAEAYRNASWDPVKRGIKHYGRAPSRHPKPWYTISFITSRLPYIRGGYGGCGRPVCHALVCSKVGSCKAWMDRHLR